MLGLDAPAKPKRGQDLIYERVEPFPSQHTAQIRQIGEGAVQIGDSKEDVGFDDQSHIGHRCTGTIGLLDDTPLVRLAEAPAIAWRRGPGRSYD